MKDYDNIGDDEIRLIIPEGNSSIVRKWWFWVAVSVVVLAVILLVVWFNTREIESPGLISNPYAHLGAGMQQKAEPALPNIVLNQSACAVVSDTTINDIVLRVYTPQNATPELGMGAIDTADSNIVMAFQAADIRADNHQIVGDFILKGAIVSNGKSKKAFCAIIDGKTYIDNSESTPLLDEAIEKHGDFFRQYPLVINGNMSENKPKGKSIRYALCEKEGVIMVVSSVSRESFHDFAQALADFDVQQAIYLTGGNSYGFCRTEANQLISWGDASEWDDYAEGLNFIVWKSVCSGK